MIHRAPFGSMERFVAVLIEHTGGKFPLWLTRIRYVSCRSVRSLMITLGKSPVSWNQEIRVLQMTEMKNRS